MNIIPGTVVPTFLITIFFLQVSTLFAQFNYGLRAGGQVVTLHSTDFSHYEWRPSYHGGLFFTYQFSKRFSGTADVLYSDKGYRIRGNDGNYNNHMKYLSVPVMAVLFKQQDFFSCGW